MGKTIELKAGDRFGRLTIIAFSHVRNTKRYYRCRCDCGVEKAVQVAPLRRGTTLSCGCLHSERASSRAAVMGKTRFVRVRLEGRRFGRWTVLGIAPDGPTRWLCRCDCGTQRTLIGSSLTTGNSRSCGCLFTEALTARNLTHGSARTKQKTREYRIWAGMWTRCTNPKRENYPRYGGRGIRVCDRWKSFENFLADMGEIPAPMSIDRIDVDGDYEPGNCRIATSSEQTRNRRNSRTQ